MEKGISILDNFYKYIKNIDSLYNLSETEFEEYNDRLIKFLTMAVFNRKFPYKKASQLALKLSNIGDAYSAYLFLNAESKTRKDRQYSIFYKAKAATNLSIAGMYNKAEILLLDLINEVGTTPVDIGLQSYILLILSQINAIFKEDLRAAEKLLEKVSNLYMKAPENLPPEMDYINRADLFLLYYNTLFDIYNRIIQKSKDSEKKQYIHKIETLIKEQKPDDEYFNLLNELNQIEYHIAIGKYQDSLNKLDEFNKKINDTPFEKWLIPSLFRDYSRIYSKMGDDTLMYKYVKMSIMSTKIYGNALDETIMVNDIIDIMFKNSEAVKKNTENIFDNKFIEQLMRLLRLKDWYTSADHSASVRTIASNVTDYLITHKELKVNGNDLSNLKCGAYLHDIGKLYIPWYQLNKITPLTNEEFTLIKNHTIFGKKILDRLGLSIISKYALGHHERINRKGYPYRVKPDLLTNIVSVSDYFDAATSTSRKYKIPKSYDRACSELMSIAGQNFYPQVTNALCAIVESGGDPKQRAGKV